MVKKALQEANGELFSFAPTLNEAGLRFGANRRKIRGCEGESVLACVCVCFYVA